MVLKKLCFKMEKALFRQLNPRLLCGRFGPVRGSNRNQNRRKTEPENLNRNPCHRFGPDAIKKNLVDRLAVSDDVLLERLDSVPLPSELRTSGEV